VSTRWQDIFFHLEKNGFEVFSPGRKLGVCKSPYIVVTHDGSTRKPGISTNVDLYSVLVYVPKENYSELEVQVQKVKIAMKKLEPMILPYGSQTPSYYDDGFQAHMVSIVYKNYKKML
jgi:hypothetical protein